jgi:hypothetical protein
MTFKRLAYLIRNGGATIAIFGAARLVKSETGHIELRGGSLADRRAAREWCSHFCHEAVIDVAPPAPLPTRHCAISKSKSPITYLQAA